VVTGQDRAPGANRPSGLIMVLHINASQQAGGVVSIHPFALVPVAGRGLVRIEDTLAIGGPTELVQAIRNVTKVQIQHYARIDLPHVATLIDTMGGVNVDGMHFDGAGALQWVRDSSIDEEGRVLRQQALIRAVMRELAHQHLLTNVQVLNALTSMLTVDSDFTNSDLLALARALGNLSASAGTFVRAPYRISPTGTVRFLQPAAHQLWAAIRQDAIAAWAAKFPQWVTPEIVR
jgi:anionic cell wall polymer biosynthesis LytR-Cps2A-Psr (LCP) family protein